MLQSEPDALLDGDSVAEQAINGLMLQLIICQATYQLKQRGAAHAQDVQNIWCRDVCEANRVLGVLPVNVRHSQPQSATVSSSSGSPASSWRIQTMPCS